MITKIYIDNFKGISNPIEVSMIASNKIKRKDSVYYVATNNKKILKTIGIIGANGSGKTSFIKAIDVIETFITFPFRKNIDKAENFNDIVENLTKESLKEFLLSFSKLELPEQNVLRDSESTTICIEFLIPKRENNIAGLYEYTLIYDSNYTNRGVIKEELRYKENIEDSLYKNLFSVSNNLESEIGTTVLYENNDNIQLNPRALSNINYYKTFIEEITKYTLILKDGVSKHNIIDMYKASKNNFLGLCKIADEKIKNVNISLDESGKEYLCFEMGENKFLLFHQLSYGTKKIIIFGCEFLNAIYTNSTLIVDELESHLHCSLSLFLVKLINNSHLKYCPQLIFTTHSPELSFILDNDQIYYIDNKNNQYTCLNLTQAINNHIITKDKNPYNAMLEGLLIKNPSQQNIANFLNNIEYSKLDL